MLEATGVVRRLYFGRDDAERDMATGLLRPGFLPNRAYEEALSGRKSLVIGRKGSGKSAICVQLASGRVREGGTSLITPDDAAGDELRRFELQGLTDQMAKSLIWRYVFAVQSARYLVAHSKQTHQAKPRSVGALRRFLKSNGEWDGDGLYDRVLTGIRGLQTSISLEAFGVKGSLDVKGQSEGARASKQLDVIERGVAQAFTELGCGKHEPFLILVDQIEQVWSGDADSKAMVKGLLLAGQHVAGTVYGGALRCVLFLRSDIYDSLDFGEGDKFHGDEMRINWTAAELSDVALARAGASLGEELTADELWNEVFQGGVADGEDMPEYMFRRVLLRPRDVIQFLNQCRDRAADQGHDRIKGTDIIPATQLFSQWKLKDLSAEYQVNYPFLENLFVMFQNSGYIVTRAALAARLRDHVDALARRFPDYVDAFSVHGVLDILYAIGFLGIKRAGGVAYADGVHVGVQPSEKEFYIHPCFRPALNSVRPIEIDSYSDLIGVQTARGNYQANSFSIAAGRDVQIGYSQDAFLLDSLASSCERILRQLGRSSISTDMRDQVSGEVGKVLQAAVERRKSQGGRAGEAAGHVIKAAGFLESLAVRLDQNGLADQAAGERLIRTIRTEASGLIREVGGTPRD